MRSILKHVQSNVERASDVEKKCLESDEQTSMGSTKNGLETTEQDLQEINEIKRILESIDKDIDEDLLAAMDEFELSN